MEVSGQLQALAALPPGKQPFRIHWIWGCVDSGADQHVLDVYFLFWESNQEYSNVQPAYTIQVFCIITLINNNTSKHCDYVFFRPTCFGHRIIFEGVFDMLRSVKWKASVPCVQFDLETGFETEVCGARKIANETVWYVLDGLYFNWNQYV